MSSFFAMLSRIKYIGRWGLMRSSRTETLSEHSLETAVIAHALVAIGIEKFNCRLNPETAAVIGMYHDASEIVTGDLPTPIKYKNESIASEYKSIEKEANKKLLSLLPSYMLPHFEKYFLSDESFPQYMPYIKAADKISAIIKCIEEEKSGNREFSNAVRVLMQHESLSLLEAKVFLEEFLPAYSLTLDDIWED